MIVAAIFASMALSPAMTRALQGVAALGPVAFAAGLGLVLLLILVHGMTRLPVPAAAVPVLALVAVGVLLCARITAPAARTHLVEYAALAIMIHAALRERARTGRPVAHAPLLAFALAGLIGTLDEAVQALVPTRVFDPIDILFNLGAAAGAVGASTALARVQGRGKGT